MPIEVEKADMSDVYCPYCDTFYGYVSSNDWGFYDDKKESERTCRKCNKPFVIRVI